MKLINGDNYGVYIYPEDHPPQHCHVRYNNGSENLVALPSLKVLRGPRLARKVHDDLLANLDMLTKKWDELNSNNNER